MRGRRRLSEAVGRVVVKNRLDRLEEVSGGGGGGSEHEEEGFDDDI
jgi:hypothetical protein